MADHLDELDALNSIDGHQENLDENVRTLSDFSGTFSRDFTSFSGDFSSYRKDFSAQNESLRNVLNSQTQTLESLLSSNLSSIDRKVSDVGVSVANINDSISNQSGFIRETNNLLSQILSGVSNISSFVGKPLDVIIPEMSPTQVTVETKENQLQPPAITVNPSEQDLSGLEGANEKLGKIIDFQSRITNGLGTSSNKLFDDLSEIKDIERESNIINVDFGNKESVDVETTPLLDNGPVLPEVSESDNSDTMDTVATVYDTIIGNQGAILAAIENGFDAVSNIKVQSKLPDSQVQNLDKATRKFDDSVKRNDNANRQHQKRQESILKDAAKVGILSTVIQKLSLSVEGFLQKSENSRGLVQSMAQKTGNNYMDSRRNYQGIMKDTMNSMRVKGSGILPGKTSAFTKEEIESSMESAVQSGISNISELEKTVEADVMTKALMPDVDLVDENMHMVLTTYKNGTKAMKSVAVSMKQYSSALYVDPKTLEAAAKKYSAYTRNLAKNDKEYAEMQRKLIRSEAIMSEAGGDTAGAGDLFDQALKGRQNWSSEMNSAMAQLGISQQELVNMAASGDKQAFMDEFYSKMAANSNFSRLLDQDAEGNFSLKRDKNGNVDMAALDALNAFLEPFGVAGTDMIESMNKSKQIATATAKAAEADLASATGVANPEAVAEKEIAEERYVSVAEEIRRDMDQFFSTNSVVNMASNMAEALGIDAETVTMATGLMATSGSILKEIRDILGKTTGQQVKTDEELMQMSESLSDRYRDKNSAKSVSKDLEALEAETKNMDKAEASAKFAEYYSTLDEQGKRNAANTLARDFEALGDTAYKKDKNGQFEKDKNGGRILDGAVVGTGLLAAIEGLKLINEVDNAKSKTIDEVNPLNSYRRELKSDERMESYKDAHDPTVMMDTAFDKVKDIGGSVIEVLKTGATAIGLGAASKVLDTKVRDKVAPESDQVYDTLKRGVNKEKEDFVERFNSSFKRKQDDTSEKEILEGAFNRKKKASEDLSESLIDSTFKQPPSDIEQFTNLPDRADESVDASVEEGKFIPDLNEDNIDEGLAQLAAEVKARISNGLLSGQRDGQVPKDAIYVIPVDEEGNIIGGKKVDKNEQPSSVPEGPSHDLGPVDMRDIAVGE